MGMTTMMRRTVVASSSRFAMCIAAGCAIGAAAPAAADNTFSNLQTRYTSIDARRGGLVDQPLEGFWWMKDGLRSQLYRVTTAQQLNAKLARFQGAAFAPVLAGRYIHVVAVAAPAGYKAQMKLAWDYRPLTQRTAIGRVQVLQGSSVVVDGGASSGSRVVAVDRPGRQVFLVKVFDPGGREVHRDQLVADIPNIPGLN
jgi:hypothetical protein